MADDSVLHSKKKSRVDATASIGQELTELAKAACADAEAPIKSEATWGVTREADPRMTAKLFGDFKTEHRRKTEELLKTYLQQPSAPRAESLSDFDVAVTIAAPGTGKTRLLDDAVRWELESADFDHFLRLAITFNSFTSYVGDHPLASRLVHQFFCGWPASDATNVLRAIDRGLTAMFPRAAADEVAQKVLDALEAIYFEQRGGVLGRTVLLIDEVSKAARLPTTDELIAATNAARAQSTVAVDPIFPCQQDLFNTIVTWLNGGAMADARRGAVFTGLTIVSPWAPTSDGSKRRLLWLPLGTFDVWNDAAQVAITARAIELWPGLTVIPDHVWPLLAVTGGRPRDINEVFKHLAARKQHISTAPDRALLDALYAVHSDDRTFVRYLLPSLLGVTFTPFDDGKPTQFGCDATSPALLNADSLARPHAVSLPAVSLRYVNSIVLFGDEFEDVRVAVHALMCAATFFKLNTGFETVWALLTYTTLLLQFSVRRNECFWPVLNLGVAVLGGRERPTRKQIDVFAVDDRVDALFAYPSNGRVFEAAGSTIRRKLELCKLEPTHDEKPTLALWKDVWTATVEAGSEAPTDWPHVSLDVEWRPSTIVLFENRSSAIDFMLLVGEKGGTGDNEPHVYMFQSQAPSADSVRMLKEKLDELFGASHESTHVLRRAGVHNMRQVTLCVAAISLGDTIDLTALGAPFNVVLFDAADFRALGGAAFRNTAFFHHTNLKTSLVGL